MNFANPIIIDEGEVIEFEALDIFHSCSLFGFLVNKNDAVLPVTYSGEFIVPANNKLVITNLQSREQLILMTYKLVQTMDMKDH